MGVTYVTPTFYVQEVYCEMGITVILKNIQSIKYCKYEFPETGLVTIVGGNSNGKSILIKALESVSKLKIKNDECRKALIKRGEEVGTIFILHNNVALNVELSKDRGACSVTLQRANGEKVRRTFRDGGIEELLYEFGFRVYSNNQICLQIYETFGLMPFVNTSDMINGEIVEAVTEDSVAKEFLEAFKEHTYKNAKTMLKTIDDKIVTWESVLKNLVVYDYKKYEEMAVRLEDINAVLQSIDVIELEELKLPPRVKFIDIDKFELEKLHIPPNVNFIDIEPPVLHEISITRTLPFMIEFEDLGTELENMNTILNGVCPTCGKPLFEKHCIV